MQTCPHCHRAIIPKSFGWDYERRVLVCRGVAVNLSPTQAAIFDLLHRHNGQVVPPSRLEAQIYGLLDIDTANNLRSQITKIRRKLPDGIRIENAWYHRDRDGEHGGYWLEWS